MQVLGSRIAVYGLGTWFVPCEFEDAVCHARMAKEVQQAGIPKGK